MNKNIIINKYEKKYIVYVGNFDVSKLNAAGKRVLNNSKLLEQLGYTVILIETTKSMSISEKPRVISNNIFLFSIPYPQKYIDRIHYKKTYKYVISILTKPEWKNQINYMIFYGTPTLSAFVKKMLNYNKKNNIISIADTVDWLKINFKNPIIKTIKIMDSYNKRRINKKMDGVIVISEYLKRYYKKKNTILIPPLMDYNYSLISSNNKNEVTKKIYYAGNPFRNNKENITGNDLKDRIDLIISLLIKTKEDFILDIYGVTKDEFIKAFPNDSNIENEKIHFWGKTDNDLIISKANEYDFSILFRDDSRESNAGFSTKLAESITMFVPVITNNTGDINKYITDGLNGFIINIKDEQKATLQLKKILKLSNSDIKDMKTYCKENQIFDLRNYIDTMDVFLKKIKK